MFIFGLHSTSDDQPNDPSDESHLKCKNMAAKSSNYEMFIFELHSTSDDHPSDLSDLKCKKMATKTSKNEMYFWITFNF